MLSSLFAGISGLNAQSNAMAVIGDNIANVNTTGFKSSTTSFANILSQSTTGYTGNEIGRGVTMSGITASMTQGSLETTSSATDLAILGQGFFQVKNSDGVPFYTRAGEFKFDKVGNLVDNNGMVVQGWDLSSAAGTGGALADIVIPNGGSTPANPTTEFLMELNLDSDPPDDELTYTSNITVFDSLGNDIQLTINFTKNTGGGWNWVPEIPASAGTVASGGGTLTFNSQGVLQNSADETITLNLLSDAASPQSITWDLVDDTSTAHGDITGYAATSSRTFMQQDGYASGSLQSLSVNDTGIITGVYSNGQTNPLFQVAVATFPSSWGLTKKGGNLYSESLDSGQPLIGVAGSGVFGSINSKSLEMSNVDLASEFVDLITTQRAFQANSKVITASDEILTELINIKR